MSLQIRRGTDAERLTITPLTAELIYTTDTQLVYVGDGTTVGGILVGSGGGNGNYGNANVVALLNSGLAGNIIPTVDSLYSLGNATHQWADLYVSNATIYMNNVPLSANATTVSFDGVPLISASGDENISTTGDVEAGNIVIGSVSGGITFGDGTTQTTAAQPYLDSDVANFLASGTDTQNIITTANVSAAFFIGDGGFLSNVGGGGSYGNADVALYLPTYTGNLAGGNIELLGTTSRIEAAGTIAILPSFGNTVDLGTTRLLGDITPLNAMGGNVGTAGLPFFNGQFVNVLGDTIISTGEITGAHIIGEGGNLSNITAANITGTVASATIAASANAVAGANVTGTVANATFATTAGSADSVAGANVTGTVANATFATTSGTTDSVAGANVTGQVANALIAGTVYEASQPNITSVGTLVDLTVTGNVIGDYFIGNGSQLTGLPAGYSNADVSTYLASGTDTAGIVTTGNISGNYILGDGSQLTNLPPAQAVSIPAVYFDVVADGNNQTFSNTILSAYNSNTDITLFYNGALLDSPYYTLSGDTITVNTELQIGDSIDIIRQFASNVIVSTYGNTNVHSYLESGLVGNIIPAGNNIASLGNATNQFKDVWVSNATIFFDGLPLSVNANSDITFNGDPLLVTGGNQTISTSGNVDAGNIIVTGDTNSDSFSGNTANFAGNVDAGNITIGGNVTANYYEGNTANFSGNVTVSGVLTNNYFFANGAPVSFDGTYSNSNVASYLPTYTGNLDNIDSVTSTGNITVGTGAFFIGDGGLLSNISGGSGTYSNANVANYLPTYTGDLANVNMANSLGVLMGTPTQGTLVSNAVTLTTTTALTNGIALLNSVLGKLVPPSPPAFPASQTLSVTGLSSYRMANTSQVDNIPSGGHTVAGGTTVTTVKRTAAYTTNTIATAGPGDSGTVAAIRNEVTAGSVALTGSSNGTYGNLVITNNQDYNTSNSQIAAGFWYVFSSALSGTVPAGWNSVQITDTAAGSTNTVVWYYDASAPGTPQFSSVTMTPPGSPTVIYSSTIPNYTNVNQFAIGFTANRLSGDMYPTSDTFATGTAGGAFAAPASRTYQTSSLGTNVLTSNASASVTTTATVISGFGSSSTGPTISVVNSYATGTQTLTAALGNTVLYKTGTVSTMEETNITIGSPIGSGTTPAFRIVNPGATDTPVFTGTEAAFNSQTSTLETYDATIVAAILKHDQTNYSISYLPAGPNLSVGRSGAQYFTFKFVRTATSKFDIKFSGTIAGMWVALPGSVIDAASTLNGWIDASINYAGSGVPGASIPDGGNGSNGCGLGSTAPLNTLSTNVSTTVTFGTASSSSTVTNEIYVRIKLTAGQTVTALSLQTGSR